MRNETNKKPIVVALLGRAGSGKSTAAKHLAEEYGFHRISFAGPLKRLAQHLLDFSDEQCWGTQAQKEALDERYGFSSREFMMRLGDGARVYISPTVWVDALLTEISDIFESRSHKGHNRFVIEDCRYVNEAETLANLEWLNGFVVKLICPDAQSTADKDHPSEAEVDQVPVELLWTIIESHRSPGSEDLKEKIDYTVKNILHKCE